MLSIVYIAITSKLLYALGACWLLINFSVAVEPATPPLGQH